MPQTAVQQQGIERHHRHRGFPVNLYRKQRARTLSEKVPLTPPSTPVAAVSNNGFEVLDAFWAPATPKSTEKDPGATMDMRSFKTWPMDPQVVLLTRKPSLPGTPELPVLIDPTASPSNVLPPRKSSMTLKRIGSLDLGNITHLADTIIKTPLFKLPPPPPPPTLPPPVSRQVSVNTSKKAAQWIDSDFCVACQRDFSFVARQHHCRNCGRAFCDNCSSNNSAIPGVFIDAVRVCDSCYEDLTEARLSATTETPVLPPRHNPTAVHQRHPSNSFVFEIDPLKLISPASALAKDTVDDRNANSPFPMQVEDEHSGHRRGRSSVAFALPSDFAFTAPPLPPRLSISSPTTVVAKRPALVKRVSISTTSVPAAESGIFFLFSLFICVH
jgi:hypothetical protein